MKKRSGAVLAVVAALCMPHAFVSCGSYAGEEYGDGELRLAFDLPEGGMLRSVTQIPDTSDFILTVTDVAGNVVFDGKYGDCPESLAVKAGSYTVRARSSDFSKPSFSTPQFGDEQCVVVRQGEVVNVRLLCRQLNSGIRLLISEGFLTMYPSGVLFLKSARGKLMYSYSEKRIAYFDPGPVSLLLSLGSKDEVLTTRELEPQEILTLGVDVSGSGPSSVYEGITMSLDTARIWSDDRFVIGGETGGQTPQTAIGVAQARTLAPMEDVWVSGYIVGGDLTSASGSFEEPFKSRTNIILGPRSSTTDRDVCLAVQLTAGSLRDELNLVDNPSLLGCKVCLKGDIVADYFNMTGLKNLADCEF